MATRRTTDYFNFKGRIGNLVLCQWRGVSYIRTVSEHRNDARSVAQLTQRSKLKQAHHLAQAMLPLIRRGYRTFAYRQSCYNAALSQFMRQCFQGVYPEVELLYTHILLGMGPLTTLSQPSLSIENRALRLTWSTSSSDGNSSPTDHLLVALYNTNCMRSLVLMDLAERADGELCYTLPTDWADGAVHCFAGFENDEGTLCSNITHIEQA